MLLEDVEQVPDTTEQKTTAQDTVRDSSIEDSISHWLSSITDGTAMEKKRKRKHKHTHNGISEDAASEEDIEKIVVECADIPPKKKKSKSKKDEQIVKTDITDSMETVETATSGKKNKRKHKTSFEGPVDKKVKLQEDVMADSPKVKKHKKVKN